MTQKKTDAPAAGFDDWCDMWEKAQGDGTFENAPKPPPARGGSSFFGVHSSGPEADMPPAEADTEYWSQVYQRSNNAGDSPDVAYPEFLQEQKKPVEKVSRKCREPVKKKKHKPLPETVSESKKTLGDVAKAQLKSPNPIYYYSAGKDQEPHVTPNFSDGPGLKGLVDLKMQMHTLEGKLNTMLGHGKPDRQVAKLEQELRKLRDRLDELSDSLHGGWTGEVED